MHWSRPPAYLSTCSSKCLTLQVLEVTPRPQAIECRLDVRLPPAARLQQVVVHGSFARIISPCAAPQVVFDTPAVIRCAQFGRGGQPEVAMHLSTKNAETGSVQCAVGGHLPRYSAVLPTAPVMPSLPLQAVCRHSRRSIPGDLAAGGQLLL